MSESSTPVQRARGAVDRAEVLLGVALTVAAAALAVNAFRCAGPLWRDEVCSVNLAAMPRLADVFGHLTRDSCPLLWPSLLRGWMAAGMGGTDLSLRIPGLLIGLGTLSVLWWCARLFGRRSPLLSLFLFALSPVVFLYADSIRAYGLGVLTLLLTLCAVWRLVRKPTVPGALLALLFSVLAVHSAYSNAVMLLAIDVGGVVVCLRKRDWHAAGLVVAIGALAALTLLPYYPTYRAYAPFAAMLRTSVSPRRIAGWFYYAMRQPLGGSMFWIWAGLGVAGALAAGRQVLRPASSDPEGRRNAALFVLTVMAVACLGFAGYLRFLGVSANPWYFLPIMALSAVLIDAAVGWAVDGSARRRMLRFALIAAAAVLLLGPLWGISRYRRTNIDRIASVIEERGGREDFILVDPCSMGPTFWRYYHGTAPWMTSPALIDPRFQSWDVAKVKAEGVPSQGVFEGIEAALRGGHQAWFVVQDAWETPEPAPGGDSSSGRSAEPELRDEVASFVRAHAAQVRRVPLPGNDPVIVYEDMILYAAEGWR